ncbi:hypothetical protein QBC35DRAFT_483410 [Podospora australis]|uniref:SnoaL-like domain-containing protein n=1 Tax=Podospora australis TaxID=1536484 RepID=A0AAN6X3W2_9PEZI|nr:hypothetical protein QBC35DRAFT_483410 [Podospora australis]
MSYDTAQYLLDRANIHDTITKVPLYYDLRNIAGLRDEVYAQELYLDYTSILGGEPFTIARDEWVDRASKIFESFSSTQHVTSGLVIHLPQPNTPGVRRPDTVSLYAQVAGHMVGHPGPDGSSGFAQNGGLLEAEVQRDPALEKKGQNPWRITKYKVIKRWNKGNDDVLSHAQQNYQ